MNVKTIRKGHNNHGVVRSAVFEVVGPKRQGAKITTAKTSQPPQPPLRCEPTSQLLLNCTAKTDSCSRDEPPKRTTLDIRIPRSTAQTFIRDRISPISWTRHLPSSEGRELLYMMLPSPSYGRWISRSFPYS